MRLLAAGTSSRRVVGRRAATAIGHLIGLVSVSDRASGGVYEDKGIPALQDWLAATITTDYRIETRLIPDERAQIEATLIELVDQVNRERCELGLSCAGPRSVAEEVVEAGIDVRRADAGAAEARIVVRAGAAVVARGAVRRKGIGRTRHGHPVAHFGRVARARAGSAHLAVRLHRIGRAARTRAGAALAHVAGAGGRTADRGARLERVRGARGARTVAVLGDVAAPRRGAADGARGPECIRRTGRPGAAARLGHVACSGLRTALEVGGLEGVDGAVAVGRLQT